MIKRTSFYLVYSPVKVILDLSQALESGKKEQKRETRYKVKNVFVPADCKLVMDELAEI